MPYPTRYVIEVRLSGQEASNGNAGSNTNSAGGNDGANASGRTNNIKGKAIAVAAYGYAKRAVDKGVSHYINTVELRTGQQLYQERMQFALNVGQKLWSIGEAAAIGGMTGGPVGAVAGAAIGAATMVISSAIDYQLENSRLETARRVEQIGLSGAAVRAGCGGNRN